MDAPQLPGYGFRWRVVDALVRHRLKDKLDNYLLAEKELRARAVRLKAKPYWLVIDPSSACELRCPFCPTGKGKGTRPREVMEWERYKAVMDELGPSVIHAEFCNWGEPLINKELPRMIRYAKQFGVETHLSSHFNRMDDAVVDGLIDSGLDWAIASVDGASPETYSRYRVGGDFDRVIANIKRFVARKKARRVKRPHLVWQFLVFRHNEHEIRMAEALSKHLGMEAFGATAAAIPLPDWRPVGPGLRHYPDESGTLLRPAERERARDGGLPACVWPWLGTVVNAGGTVAPCCAIEDESQDYGRVGPGKTHAAIWNGADYLAARAHEGRGEDRGRKNACTECRIAGQANIAIPGSWLGGAYGTELEDFLKPLPWPGPFKA
ncbi:MAG: radical SAM protein [Elusimicrobiota bacterium]|nr:radical SAM protein [Elusimicrobiota bacterium]